MAKTPNLQLELTTDNSVLFKDWREIINGVGEDDAKSNMERIDAFAGETTTALAEVVAAVETVKGVSGDVTLAMESWTNNTYTLSLTELGVSDAVFFAPNTAADKTEMENANVVAQASVGTVIFTAANIPTSNIALSYFISRGGV